MTRDLHELGELTPLGKVSCTHVWAAGESGTSVSAGDWGYQDNRILPIHLTAAPATFRTTLTTARDRATVDRVVARFGDLLHPVAGRGRP